MKELLVAGLLVLAGCATLLLPASELSREHDTCSTILWSAGHPGKPASWHPTAAGHVAIADALAGLLGKH